MSISPGDVGRPEPGEDKQIDRNRDIETETLRLVFRHTDLINT